MQDAKAILGVALLLVEPYPLRPDQDRMRDVLKELIEHRSHLALVDVESGAICAILLVMTGDNLWAQRKFANVLLWWSSNPGSGVKLLRRFKHWLENRRGIRIAGFAPDIDLDDRTLKIFEYLGFRKSGGAYLFVNGAIHGTV